MSRCGHGDDAEFLDLIREARSQDWNGLEADTFWKDELPKLVLPLRRRFPELEVGEVVTRTWEVVDNLDLDKAEGCPRAWILSSARFRLGDVREELQKDERLVELLNRQERPVLTSAPADAFLDDIPWAGPEVNVWDIVRDRLLRSLWPDEKADAAVAVFREKAEQAVFEGKAFPSIEVVADALVDVPKGLKRPLARFVFARRGFLWALLKGIDPDRALCLPNPREDLADIIWPLEAASKSSRPGAWPAEGAG